MKDGLFVALEGTSGSRDSAQLRLLAERLRAAGHEVEVYDFPRYSEPSSYFIQRYLDDEYGPASEVSPYTASLFYALDRFEAAPLIRQSLSEGKIVLANQYSGSNMAHQGTKFTKAGEQRGFFVWADSLEFQLLGVPRPEVNIYLRVPDENIEGDDSDIEHLRQVVVAYDNLCQLFPKDFKRVECLKNNKYLPVTEINNGIWELIKPMLPEPIHRGHSTVVSFSNKLQSLDRPKLTEPARPTAKGDTDSSESFEIKDISLLAVNTLRGQGVNIKYKLSWPPKDSKTRLNYYIPAEFPPKLAAKYKSTMDKLITLSHKLNKSLPEPAKKYLTHLAPLALLVDAKINGNRESASRLLTNASAANLTELRQITKQTKARLKSPQTIKQIIKQIADSRLAGNSAELDRPVELLSASPRNELDLLIDCLYPYSNLGKEEIAAEVDRWTYEQKAKTLKTICSTDASSLLKKVHYHFDVVDNVPTLENLAKLLRPLELQIQPPTPRYGYRVPEGIEQAGIDEDFIKCFDLSLGLYSEIQASGMDQLAGYAVLLGHRQRWEFGLNGERVFEVYPDEPPTISAVLKLFKEQITEVHPIIAQCLRPKPNQPQNVVQKTQITSKKPFSKRSGNERSSKSKK